MRTVAWRLETGGKLWDGIAENTLGLLRVIHSSIYLGVCYSPPRPGAPRSAPISPAPQFGGYRIHPEFPAWAEPFAADAPQSGQAILEH